jgi:hypothetical protein
MVAWVIDCAAGLCGHARAGSGGHCEPRGPIRIAVIRNLGSDDNTTQFVAGAIQEGKTRL